MNSCTDAPPPVVPADFSRHLFWDVDPNTLDLEQHRKYVMARVLEFGTIEDWRLLLRCFTLNAVIATAQTFRTLDPKALSFLAALGNVPRSSFRCYTLRPLTPTLWNS
ncbi:MAG: hypothetical protein WCH61_11070 [bacterium]